MIAFELKKLGRSRRPQVAAACLALFLVLMLFGFYTYAQSQTGGRAEFRYTFENRSYFNGLTFAVYAYYFAGVLLLPIFAATEGGAQLAGETQGRTLSLLLARPLSRARLFATKVAVSAAWLALLTGGFLATSLAVGLAFVGWGDLDLYPGVLQMAPVHQHLEQSEALARFALAWPAAAVAVLAPLALSFLVSSWTASAVNAVGTSVALYLVLYLISEIHFFAELRPYLFTSYLTFWRGLFREEVDWSAVLRDGAKLLAFASLFLALAFRRFRTREEP